MRGALFLAAWVSALAVAQPALDPWLQALYGRRRPHKKDVRLLQVKLADDDYAGGEAYDYGGADYARVPPPSSLLRRIFNRADLEDDEDERTTLYCITVKPKPHTTPSTTPEVICFPPSRKPKKTRPTTAITPVGNCEDVNTASTTATPHHHYAQRTGSAHKQPSGRHDSKHHPSTKTPHSTTRPSSAKTRARKTHVVPTRTTSRTSKASKTSHRTTRSSTPRKSSHGHATKHAPTVGECAVDVFVTAMTSTSRKATHKTTVRRTTHSKTKKTHKTKKTQKPKTTHKRTTVRVTSRTTRTSHKTSAKPKQEAKWCPVVAEPEATTSTTTPRTRPPVDEFLAAWGYFRHHNSLDPRNGSHWREFHNADGVRTPRRRDLSEGVLVIVPPWVRKQPPGRPALLVPPADKRLSKRDGGKTAAPYRLFWFSSWPPAGSEVSRLPVRDKDNFVKLASWWQDVMRTYNGHQRKKRAQARP